jgi:putative tryptophan/tyrosine transport system substrate-binding protein
VKRRDLAAALAAAAVMRPWAVCAEPLEIPVIGFLSPGSAAWAIGLAKFREGLGEMGFVEGRNIAIEYRWTEGRHERLPESAADLVRRRVAVIIANGSDAARAARGATATIPIVFDVGTDPVASGLVASFSRPGGNATGFSIFFGELTAKRLELLSELVPDAAVIAFLVTPEIRTTATFTREVQAAAAVLGRQLVIVTASTPSDLDTAFAAMLDQRAGALLLTVDPFLAGQRDRIVALAARHAIPAMYQFREFVAAGGLASYGINFGDMRRQVGTYVGKILKGAKPADLPVQQPTTFELVINLKTAKALGLTVPPSILARADEVIE